MNTWNERALKAAKNLPNAAGIALTWLLPQKGGEA